MGYDGLDDYREVPERINEWYTRHPEGRIETELLTFDDIRVVVKARAFRTQDPTEPPSGIGHSYLELPGKTPFTKGSELENAETSAAGRALVMAGIPTSRIASGFEVVMKGGPSTADGQTTAGTRPPAAAPEGGGGAQTPSPPSSTLSAEEVKAIRDLYPSPAAALKAAREALPDVDLASLRDLTKEQASRVVAALAEQRSAS